ncbi:MAG TPA: peptidase domain-containing ABC transporter [Opitutaceae bacterium]|nr:peptidase domain-containing ABC transporter [Opitutaceae bacterium]
MRRSFRQHDESDCGVACLAYIAHHYGLELNFGSLRTQSGTDKAGTSALGLIEAARRSGFLARGVRGSSAALPGVPLPAIAHCTLESGLQHFVVLKRWTGKHAHVMDPGLGRIEKWSTEEFLKKWSGVLVVLSPGEEFKAEKGERGVYRRFLGLLGPHRGTLIQTTVGSLVATALALLGAALTQKMIDGAVLDGNRPLLNLVCGAMLAIAGFRIVLDLLQSLVSLRMAQTIDATLILAYYRHLMALPQPFFDSMRVGEIVSRVGDAVQIRQFLSGSLAALVLTPLILVFSLVAMFFYSWKMAMITVGMVAPTALLFWAMNSLNRRYQRRIMECGADFDAQLIEATGVQGALRAFRLESHLVHRVESRMVRLFRTLWKRFIEGAGVGVGGSVVSSAYSVGLTWVGMGMVLNSELTLGQVMTCSMLCGYFSGAVGSLFGLNLAMQETLIAADRLFEILDQEVENDQGRIQFAPPHMAAIRFVDVSYKHVGRPTLLQGINIEIPRGRITLLRGPSGCGKSTILNLLQRLYLPTEGRIFVGDLDLGYFKLASYRSHLGVMPQQTLLFSGTVLDNLSPGEAEPDMERLIGLCRAVGALGFIEQLPRGFLTHLNENGGNLSGGQRQRLALVRALYSNAPLLLLDEPTSALDEEAEARLLEFLRCARDRGTTIVIASHSGSLVAIADKVFSIQDGRVLPVQAPSERGDHVPSPGSHP